MKIKQKISLLLLAVAMFGIIGVTAVPVSAETVYPSGLTSIKDADGTHWATIYDIPYSNFGGYKVGGYNSWLLPFLYPHNDPQKWTRQSYNAGRQSLLFIPTRYIILCKCNYWEQIYVYK